MLGFCLTSDTAPDWNGFGAVAAASLNLKERVSLAYAALTSLKPDQVEAVASAVLGAAGGPLPAFLGGMDDARFWASLASRSELKGYAAAAFEAMTPKDQAAFFRHISEIEVAA